MFRVSNLCVFIAIVRGSSLRRIIRKARNKRFEREREREGEREKERSDPDRVDARVRAIRSRCWSGRLAERGREREREIGLLLPSSFLKLSFFPLGVVAAVTEALLCQPKKGEKEANLDPERAVGVGVEASGEKGPRTRD